ncbi:protein of unknown function [Rhodovulum sp. ES.010]|uniref:DUF4376 domain-containing protein n=1 Tax=Rhodovulum sp. ES.010 TaxID=1882821 RepID=UPI00092C4B0A|nr:DUF4376 domain-containing protein [Rhodovulum sp. ES.010]SIO36299.1 protein of unknown function [Rhodovulum sp. ES.010]
MSQDRVVVWEDGRKVIRAPRPGEVPPPPVPTGADVNAERDRRLYGPRTFPVAGHGDVTLAGDQRTTFNLAARFSTAQARIAAGEGATTTDWRDEDDVIHRFTQHQVADLWERAAAYWQAVYEASWALKDAPGGIPADFTADHHWP